MTDAPFGRFAVLGNHDLIADDAWLVRRLETIGVRTLVNENVPGPRRMTGSGWEDPTTRGQGTPNGLRALAGGGGYD